MIIMLLLVWEASTMTNSCPFTSCTQALIICLSHVPPYTALLFKYNFMLLLVW